MPTKPKPADFELVKLARSLANDWKEHRDRQVAKVRKYLDQVDALPVSAARREAIREMLKRDLSNVAALESDGEDLKALLLDIGGALMGRPWTGVRRAAAALREDHRGRHERMRRAIGAAAWAIRAWRLSGYARRSGERKTKYRVRLEESAVARGLHAEILLTALKGEDESLDAKVRDVVAVLDEVAGAGKASPIKLLRKVGVFADASDAALKEAQKARRAKKRKSGD